MDIHRVKCRDCGMELDAKIAKWYAGEPHCKGCFDDDERRPNRLRGNP